jgi:uncharacterized protein YfeS
MFNVIETDSGRIFICTDEKLEETKRSLTAAGEEFDIRQADEIEIRVDASVKIY